MALRTSWDALKMEKAMFLPGKGVQFPGRLDLNLDVILTGLLLRPDTSVDITVGQILKC